MHIAYLTQSYPPMVSGAAIFARQVATAMADRGHGVMVLAASETGQTYVRRQKNLITIRLRSVYNPMRVGQRLLLFPRRGVLQALQEFQPDLIHTHDPLQIGWLGHEYACHAGIPIILTLHQLPRFAVSYMPKIGGLCSVVEASLWIYARWLLPKFTAIITPSQTTAAMVTKQTGVLTRILSNGVDLQMYHPPVSLDERRKTCLRFNLPTDVPIILHVGRLDVDKKVDYVIQAAAHALHDSNAHLLIVGDGQKKLRLIELCNALGIADRSHFPGYVSVQEGLPGIYRIASLFVTASEIETQGIVLLEAAASGLPIAAVKATCIPEIVRDGRNGFLSAPGDVAGLGDAMLFLLKNPQHALEMGKAGRMLSKAHDSRITLDLHEKFYAEIVQSHLARTARSMPIRSVLPDR